MNNQKSKLNIKDILLWLALAIITIATVYATYYFKLSAPIKSIIWVFWLVLVVFIGMWTSQGKEASEFAKSAKIELQKVVWPRKQETIQTTSIVMVMVAVTGFVLWGVDTGMTWAIGKITQLG